MSLTIKSKKTMEFFLPYINSIIDNKNFIKKRIQKNTIKYIYNEIQAAKKHIGLLYETGQITQTFHIRKKNDHSLPKILNNKYVVDYIQAYIKTNLLGYSIIQVNLFGHDIKLFFSLFNKEDEDEYLLGNAFLTNILIWLSIASKHSKSNCAESLKIYCYMTHFKKNLPQNNYDVLSPEHCNSALTTSCTKDGEICIFRKEEFLKVLIHESFHIFGLDFSSLQYSALKKKIHYIFPVKSDMELSESYTETWAAIINSCLCADNLSKKNNFEDFIEYLDFFIRMEQIFSLFQMVKILNFMNITYENLYENDDISIAARRYLYKEKTNVFPYYIVKTIFLCNINSFLEWCKKNNEKKSNIFNFNKSFPNLESFGELIKTLYNKKSFTKQVKDIGKINKTTLQSLEFLKTMRMTLCELN